VIARGGNFFCDARVRGEIFLRETREDHDARERISIMRKIFFDPRSDRAPSEFANARQAETLYR
jgi:hypothetical protein